MDNPTATGQSVSNRQTARQGGTMGFYTRVYPRIYGGQCEKCGVLDKNQPAEYQYKLCEHYRGLAIECNYCDATKDQKEVTRISDLYVYDHPSMRDSKGEPMLAAVCNSFTCQNAFNIEYRK